MEKQPKETKGLKKESKFSILEKALAILIFAWLILLFIADRIIHVLLFHKSHDKFTTWAGNKPERKFAVARVIIFSIPIIIYKIFF